MAYINRFKTGSVKNLPQDLMLNDSIFPKTDFPIFANNNLVWFDNGATTHKPKCVIDSIKDYYDNNNSNIHRSPHNLSIKSSDMFDNARNLTAEYLGCDSKEIVFVKGATEGINFLAKSLKYEALGCGGVILSNAEHHSNIVPWQQLTDRLYYVNFDKVTNSIDLSELESYLGTYPFIKLVSINHVSNVTGITNPIKEIANIVHKYNAILIVDGAQGIPHHRVNVKDIGCDAYVFSSHKLFGPTGVGVVYCNNDLYQYLNAWQGGGSMIKDVTLYNSEYADPPHKYEAGTPNIADIIAFGETIKYLSKYNWNLVEKYESVMTEYMLKLLNTVPNIQIIGNTLINKVPIFSFELPNVDSIQLLSDLDNNGIAIRYGHHCAQPIVRYYGFESVYRASLAPYNTKADIDLFINIIRKHATLSI